MLLRRGTRRMAGLDIQYAASRVRDNFYHVYHTNLTLLARGGYNAP